MDARVQALYITRVRYGFSISGAIGILLLLAVGCYVPDHRSIHKKPEAPPEEDIFQYKSIEQLDEDLIRKLKNEGRYPEDYKVDRQSLPSHGQISFQTRKAAATALLVEFDQFTQRCPYREVKDYFVETDYTEPAFDAMPGNTMGGYQQQTKTDVVNRPVYTLLCRPQLPPVRGTRVLVVDSTDNTLQTYTIENP